MRANSARSSALCTMAWLQALRAAYSRAWRWMRASDCTLAVMSCSITTHWGLSPSCRGVSRRSCRLTQASLPSARRILRSTAYTLSWPWATRAKPSSSCLLSDADTNAAQGVRPMRSGLSPTMSANCRLMRPQRRRSRWMVAMPMKGSEKNCSIMRSVRCCCAHSRHCWFCRIWRQNSASSTPKASMARVATPPTHQASTCTEASTSAWSILATTRQSVPATGR